MIRIDFTPEPFFKNNFYRTVAQMIWFLLNKEKGNERGGRKLILLDYKLMDYIN